MASFIGTNKELRRYIGPRLRNLVQQMTKKHKAVVAACEHCDNSTNLESAHVLGRDRNEIIDIVASRYTTNGIVAIDIEIFEDEFKAEHDPIEKSILILCRSCHRKYDDKKQLATRLLPIAGKINHNHQVSTNKNNLLPITFDPENSDIFKKQLFISKRAEIVKYYSDGRIENTTWNAHRFSSSSNLLGNLRSRPQFRSDRWRSLGLVKVHVKVIQNI